MSTAAIRAGGRGRWLQPVVVAVIAMGALGVAAFFVHGYLTAHPSMGAVGHLGVGLIDGQAVAGVCPDDRAIVRLGLVPVRDDSVDDIYEWSMMSETAERYRYADDDGEQLVPLTQLAGRDSRPFVPADRNVVADHVAVPTPSSGGMWSFTSASLRPGIVQTDDGTVTSAQWRTDHPTCTVQFDD